MIAAIKDKEEREKRARLQKLNDDKLALSYDKEFMKKYMKIYIFSYKKFMLYPTIGAKFMYRHPENDNIKFSIQPTIYLPTGSITAPGSGINMWIPSISLHAGVNFKID